MLYLILPPVIIILSFGLLLWYLSRKSHDPLVAERVSAMAVSNGQGTVRFPQARVFFLRLLEKMAHHFKVSTLKNHNRMHNWLQSIKESRKRVQAMNGHSEGEQDHATPVSVVEKKRRFFGALSRRSVQEPSVQMSAEPVEAPQEQPREPGLETPFKRRRAFFGNTSDTPTTPEPAPQRPEPTQAVSAPAEKPRAAQFSEEDLISQIATNPKDFKAYESLGDYYMESGNVKDAKECYRQVLKLRPAERLVKIKIRRLEKMLSSR